MEFRTMRDLKLEKFLKKLAFLNFMICVWMFL